mmetsp:Transcript_41185/g.118461  ORF Transcript_41185/g.118461 Transcript_41185/m.118461 type:complete len:235 (-) Transcript_41185:36-740(-)
MGRLTPRLTPRWTCNFQQGATCQSCGRTLWHLCASPWSSRSDCSTKWSRRRAARKPRPSDHGWRARSRAPCARCRYKPRSCPTIPCRNLRSWTTSQPTAPRHDQRAASARLGHLGRPRRSLSMAGSPGVCRSPPSSASNAPCARRRIRHRIRSTRRGGPSSWASISTACFRHSGMRRAARWFRAFRGSWSGGFGSGSRRGLGAWPASFAPALGSRWWPYSSWPALSSWATLPTS